MSKSRRDKKRKGKKNFYARIETMGVYYSNRCDIMDTRCDIMVIGVMLLTTMDNRCIF